MPSHKPTLKEKIAFAETQVLNMIDLYPNKDADVSKMSESERKAHEAILNSFEVVNDLINNSRAESNDNEKHESSRALLIDSLFRQNPETVPAFNSISLQSHGNLYVSATESPTMLKKTYNEDLDLPVALDPVEEVHDRNTKFENENTLLDRIPTFKSI